jgi:catechol 2,3-dioxygenase-like lactoylglutathione lyase family enzyme
VTPRGGGEVHLFTNEGAVSNAAQHLCLEVDDLGAYERRLIYRVEIPEAIVNRPRLFTRDPFGNLIELVQILGPYHERDRPTHLTHGLQCG